MRVKGLDLSNGADIMGVTPVWTASEVDEGIVAQAARRHDENAAVAKRGNKCFMHFS